ncbi:iron complex transport system permease protein [Saccharothrix coeruleofusca]|uniref:FecCD family ABC transporter permease n=1 Tax=Saccharothrix coeruleofusca TaxID=33919 RepID=UPI001AE4C930|nr:iron ABC transporter permease [Saccharothrix coeruleofusca]MBP2337192.1 iron complex transport system permease protein [Saccharothrix coeruleofusca]
MTTTIDELAAPDASRARRPRAAVLPYPALLAVLAAALAGSTLLATGVGPVGVPADEVARILAHHLTGGGDTAATSDLIIWRIRFPRVLLGAVVGAGLALAGAVVQGVVRNPVADPYLLGLSHGASVGAVLVLTTGVAALGALTLPVAAFAGAAAAMAVVLVMARHRGRLLPVRLILVGVAIGHLFAGVTSFALARTDSSAAQQQIIFWLLGGLSGAQWATLPVPAAVVAGGVALLLVRARRLNALVLGEEAGAALGVNTSRLRWYLLILTTLVTGTVVAVSGGIGFVGLIVPHLARMLVGADHRRMLPVTALLGALFLLWADVAARMLISPAELPIGILTAFLGVPFFLLVMRARGLATQESAS